ncbi:hypothetical protein Ddye_031417 [Dipteronia dyeriana]|uniref:Reverse transcriptase domain-containing protein n=1 Tax=Dipteronia dyeriana TaxID=168575 RepID=A0AAD9TJG0_9ROSI|nr:hypothetical protein Ddye_031417 [Dipteronia dyeriana]
MNFLKEFHREGTVVSFLNKTFIALISKVTTPKTMKDFHHISLVGSLYKMLAKVLANLLKKVMNSIIGETQMAFVKNRQIVDSFVIVSEIIHKWKRDFFGGLLVKLDFEKAYDSVDQSFLDSISEEKGFGVTWRNWISCCISFPSLSVLVNGSSMKDFHIERGLH